MRSCSVATVALLGLVAGAAALASRQRRCGSRSGCTSRSFVAEPRWRFRAGCRRPRHVARPVVGIRGRAARRTAGAHGRRMAGQPSRHKDYLFPLQWPAYVWVAEPGLRGSHHPGLACCGGRPALLQRSRDGARRWLPVAGRRVRASRSCSSARAIALAHPASARSRILDARLPGNRLSIWSGCWRRPAPRRLARCARRRRQSLIVLSAARGLYIMYVAVSRTGRLSRSTSEMMTGGARWRGRDRPTEIRAGSPIRCTPSRYGTSVGSREGGTCSSKRMKDAALGMYDRAIAIRTRERVGELGRLRSLTADSRAGAGGRSRIWTIW